MFLLAEMEPPDGFMEETKHHKSTFDVTFKSNQFSQNCMSLTKPNLEMLELA